MNEGTRIGDMVRRKRAGGERTEYTSIAIGRIRVTWEITYVHILPSFLKKTQGTEAMAASSVSSGNWTFCRQASKCSRCVSAASLVGLVRVTWIPVFYPRPDSRNSLSTFFSLSVLCYLSLATWYETRFVAKTVYSASLTLSRDAWNRARYTNRVHISRFLRYFLNASIDSNNDRCESRGVCFSDKCSSSSSVSSLNVCTQPPLRDCAAND